MTNGVYKIASTCMNSCELLSFIKNLYLCILVLQRKKLVTSYYLKNEGTEAQADVIISVTELVQGGRTNRIQIVCFLFLSVPS